MRGYNGYYMLIGSVLSAFLLTGCGYRVETESVASPDATSPYDTNSYVGAMSMESAPIIDYTVPQMSSNILVDLNGYPAYGKKEAAVKGSRLPETFAVVDAATGEPVYYGEIAEPIYDEELGLYTGSVDFSDFDREGNYYLECDVIGRSYRFDIREDFYSGLFDDIYRQFLTSCKAGTLSVDDALDLLEVYEWYSDVFPDEDEDQVPDVLKELKEWVSQKEADGVEEGEMALYAACLAKFSYNYQKYERQYATDCLKRAATVFRQVQAATDNDADIFYALTELYRATGLSTYRNRIGGYKSFFVDNISCLEESGYRSGAMTYMATRQRVDVDLCAAFMGEIMDRAEEISLQCTDMIHPVSAKNNGAEDLLKQARWVSCANYVMNIYEYTNVIEEFLHYLMGRNLESVNIYAQGGEETGYLLLLAQMAANEL